MIRVDRDFRPGDERYTFDFGFCSYANGFAQVDTRQDAPYYGTWANPKRRLLVNYCEGDITVTRCDSDEEFAEVIRDHAYWNDRHGWGPMRIDCLLRQHEGIAARFRAIGLADLLH